MKKLLSLLLVVFMMLSSATAFAQDSPQVIKDNETGEITITGKANPNENVNVVIQKENKRYYIDSTSADNDGNYSFNTVVPVDRDYDAVVTIDGNRQEFQISKNDDENDSEITIPSLPEGQDEIKQVGNNGEEITVTKDQVDIKIPDVEKEFKVNVTANDKAVKLNIGDSTKANVKVNLSHVHNQLPRIEAENNDSALVIKENTSIDKNSGADIDLLRNLVLDQNRKKNIIDKIEGSNIISSNKKVDELEQSVMVGAEQSIVFSDYVEITFKGQAGKEAVYIQDDIIHKINRYTSDASGLASKKDEFAYDRNGDLVVKTKHFTDFIVFSTKDKKDDDSGSSNPSTPSHKYITLSVDKLTINKGYVISPTRIEFNNGESVWDVLKDELDSRNISYDYQLPSENKYKSVYIKYIDGDGQFDHGVGSGWMYCVNGKYPNYGVDKYKLHNGDRVKIRYTTNLGGDLNAGDWDDSDDDDHDSHDSHKSNNSKPDKNNTTKESSDNEGSNKDEVKEEQTKDTSLYLDEEMISDWAKDAVEQASELKFINGYNNKFNPKGNISRAQFTKLIALLLDLDLHGNETIGFADISKDAWYRSYVNAAYNEDIIKGYGSLFKPDDNITREQMASIIVRALKLKERSSDSIIKDIDNVSDWAVKDVETAYSHRLINGYGGNFNPKEYVTREMAAVIIIRAYELKGNLKEEDLDIDELDDNIKRALDETTNYMIENVKEPIVGSVGGEWAVLGLARRNADVPKDYYDNYYKTATKKVKEQQAKSSRRWSTKVTDTQRVAIALTAIGKNPSDVEGIDLVDYTWNKGMNMPSLSEEHQILGNRQGLNELIYGLITIDLNNSKMPEDASISREEIIKRILEDYETDEGGFNLRQDSETADADLTGMTIQALAPYYEKDGYENVTKAVNRALETLSSIQDEKGGFTSEFASFTGGAEATVESTVQVIVALCSLDIDPTTDNRFIKNGNDPITNLMTYYNQGGGFKHLVDGEVNQMATEQGYYALVAYERFVNNQNSLYDMSDVNK